MSRNATLKTSLLAAASLAIFSLTACDRPANPSGANAPRSDRSTPDKSAQRSDPQTAKSGDEKQNR
jgi:hypothetical protein